MYNIIYILALGAQGQKSYVVLLVVEVGGWLMDAGVLSEPLLS